MDELDFESDSFSDIIAHDDRYNPRAYALLADVIRYLNEGGHHATSQEILDDFRLRTLDLYGPMSYTVLRAWGVKRTEDIGEMMSNFVESRRVRQDENDSLEDFANGFDFREAFLMPFAAT